MLPRSVRVCLIIVLGHVALPRPSTSAEIPRIANTTTRPVAMAVDTAPNHNDHGDMVADPSRDANGNSTFDQREPVVVYVDEDAGGLNNGTSWTDAFTDLQDALGVAGAPEGPVEEVWVAEGIYRAASAGGDRTASFQLLSSVGVYGGFAGFETIRDQRAPSVNVTILSGDLDGDDFPVPCTQHSPDCDSYGGLCKGGLCIIAQNSSDNSYHVVNGSGTDQTAILDGFTIEGGNAERSATRFQDTGGGMFIDWGSPTVVDCLFTRNQASFGGGGLMALTNSHPKVIGCRFVGNTAVETGGGMDTFFENAPEIRNCVFLANSSKSGGGLHISISCEPTVVNCLFNGNSAQDRGGALRAVGAVATTLTNCTFSGNMAGEEGEAIHNRGSDLSLISCILWGNTPAEISEFVAGSTIVTYPLVAGGWPGDGNTSTDPMFVDADGPDDVFGTDDDDLRLLSGSPGINTGDPTLATEPGATDLDGNPRVRGCRVDMGAYETDELQTAGDFDADEDVDLADYQYFETCFGGVDNGPAWFDTCLCVFNVDDDAQITFVDYLEFKSHFRGPIR